jgi:iron complex outermembrane receptor protein
MSNQFNSSLKSRLFVATAIASSLALPAFAQQEAQNQPAASAGMEEIVVTAQRREEKLLNVPIAVSAFNAETLRERNITDINGLIGFAPNVKIVQSPGYTTESDISIRGSITINPAPYWEPAVGLYVDGIYIPKAIGDVFDVADLDHIEILRGPQGTLYGRNTLEGAVNIVTKKPTGQFDGYVQFGAGNYGDIRTQGVVDLPAIGKLSLKLSGLIESRDGFVSVQPDPFHLPISGPPSVGDLYSLYNRAARISARLDITDDITADYAFDVNQERNRGNFSQLTRVGSGGIFDPSAPAYLGIPLYLYIQHNPASQTAYVNGANNNSPIFEDSGVRAHSLILTWDANDNLTLKSLTSYRWIDWSNSLDLDGSPMEIAGTQLYTHYHAFSQELQATGQFDRFHYTAGAYYFNDRGMTFNPQEFFLGGAVYDSRYGYGTEAYALYGQIEYNPAILDDRLTLIAGLRYSNEDKFGSRYEAAGTLGGLSTVIPWISATKSFAAATPTYIAKYAVTDQVNVYAKYAEGFKSGGFNGEAASAIEAITPFDAESVNEWEVGVKSRWLDGRLNIDAAAFYDQHNNMQLSVFLGTGAVASVVRNAGSADIDGFEVQMQALPMPWLQLTGNVGYMNATYNRFINNGVNVASTAAFPAAPQFTANAGVDATLMDNDIGQLHLLVDYIHSDAYYFYPYSLSANPAVNGGYYAGSTKASPQNVVNMRLRLVNVQLASGTVDVEMWGENIFNDKYRINGIDFGPGFGNMTVSNYGPPPTFGGDVTFHW